jgi:hypothetical protein
MTASDSPTITSVGDAIFDDIDRDLAAGGYDRAIIFTYTLKPKYSQPMFGRPRGINPWS